MNKIYIPKVNVSDSFAKVTNIFFSNNDVVKVGDILLAVETSKADFDVESEYNGYVFYEVSQKENVSFNKSVAIVFDTVEELHEYQASKNNGDCNENFKDDKNTDKVITKAAKKLIAKYSIDISNLEDKLITESTIIKLLESKENQSIKFNDKDIVIFGTGGAALMVKDAIIKQGIFTIVGYIDDFSEETIFESLPIFGGIEVLDNLIYRGLSNLVLAFGFIGHLDTRLNVFKQFQNKINFPNIIDSRANLEDSVILGVGNIILSNSYIGSKVQIGDINIINTGAIISHECIISSANHFTPSCTIAGQVIIGSLNTFGMNSSILMKTKVGDRVLVSNNVATTSNLESSSIIK